MSEATEDTSAGLAPGEDSSKPGMSNELLDRLRALEAENSALAQANENQRESYERCLDEVANHVVQALLNQKDLREECIKLKKRVYELERQNRTLSDLFHQKFQITSGSLPPLPVHPFQVLSNLSLVPHLDSMEKLSTSLPLGHCVIPKQASPEKQQMGGVILNPSSSSMEALSPFLKKKAQILEVLRKLEEMDPLMVCPRSNPGQCFSAQNCQGIRNSCSLKYKQDGSTRHESGSPEYLNGAGFLPAGIQVPEYEPWTACLLLAPSSFDDLLKWKPACSDSSGTLREEEELEETMALVQEDCRDLDGAEAELLSHYCERKSTGSSSSSSDDNCELGEPNLLEKSPPESLLSMIAEKVAFGQLLEDTESYLYSVMKERSKCSALDGDQTISLLCEEQTSNDGKKGSDEKIPKDGFTGADSGCVNKSLEGEMLQEEKYNHTRTVNCYSQSVEGLSHHNTEDKVQEIVSSEDIDPWKETGKAVLDSTSDCSPPSKCRVNMPSQPPLENNALFSMYVSSNSLNTQQRVGESTSTCNITEKTVHDFPTCSSQGKNELQINPSSTVDSEERRAPQIPSPSKFLKLLKIPMVGERTQSPNHLRLSPQLTRSSKIPCRNNYEVCHSPLLRRKTVVEQVPEGTGKNESLYGIPSLTVSVDSEIGFGNSGGSSLKASRHLVPGMNKAGLHDLQSFEQETQSFQKAPNYENVCFAINSMHSSPKLDHSKHFLHPTHVGNQEASQDKGDASELMESVYYSTSACLGMPPQTTLLSNGASLSCSQGLCSYSSTKDKQKEKLSSESKEKKFESPQVLQRNSGSTSASKRMGGITVKKQEEPSGYLPFRERLTALGKLKSSESPFQGAERKEALCEERETSPVKTNSERHRITVRQCEINERLINSVLLNSEASESREYPKRPPGVNSLKHQERCFSEDIGVKLYHSNSVGSKLETENYSSKIYIAKGEVSKNKVTGAFCSPGSPQVSRTSAKIPITPNFCKNPKSPHGSPTKLPSKSPTKAPVKGGVSRPLSDEMRSCSRTGGSILPSTHEEKSKIQQLNPSRKSFICPENICQDFTRASHKAKNTDNMPLSSMLHSAIEEKVMKGIKENMLRLQEQDKVPVTEGKQKSSSSIASWFGLKKSKLPALSRRPDTFKTKDEKREWSVGSSPLRKEVKMATKKMEAESLNISMLMEKAEDLRKALEEEKAYMNGVSLEKSRGLMCCDTEQSELGVPYSKEARPDSFMQQLLNRVDGKEISSDSRPEPRNEQKPLQDSKGTKTCHATRIGVMSRLQTCEENPDQNKDVVRGEVPSEESLVESVTTQHFPACGSLTRTLDSGIGTFPPPDYCGGTPNKIAPKLKPRLEPPLIAEKLPVLPKAPRKARTLEREVPSMEETLSAGQHQSVPAFHALLASPETPLGNRVHKICKEACSRNPAQPKRIQHSNNWTFPNLKASAGSTDMFLSSSRNEVLHSSLGQSSKGSPSEAKRSNDMLHLAPHFSGSRTPSTSDVGDEGGADMRSTDTGQGQAGLENSESLSDSLYDSLSSCGSQG